MVRTHQLLSYHLTPSVFLTLPPITSPSPKHMGQDGPFRFEQWCLRHGIKGVELTLQWRRTHYAVEMPTIPRFPPLLEKPPLDYYLEAKRTDRWLLPNTIDFLDGGIKFFRARALQIFEAAIPAHQPFFAALLDFLTIARMQHPYVVTGEGPKPNPSGRPAVPPDQRIYAPAWTQSEVADLRRIFGPDETGHRMSLNTDDWDALLPRLQPHHRDRRAVYRKIVCMNEALRKSLLDDTGALTPLGRREYMKKRLGQFERAPRIRKTDAEYRSRVMAPPAPPAKEANPGVAPSLRDDEDKGTE